MKPSKAIGLLSFALLAVSCQDMKEGNGSINIAEGSTFAPVIASAGGTATIEFTTNCDWNANVPNISSYSWSSITPTSGGAGTNVITVTALRNDNHDDRSFTFDIKASGALQTVTVTQRQKDALTVTSGDFNLPEDGGDVKIELMANIEYTFKVEQDGEGWIVPVPAGKALEPSELLFKVLPTDVFEVRTGHITISSEGLPDETITVTQAAKTRVFEVSPTTITIDKEKQEVSFTVNANFDYEVSEIPAEVGWISLRSSDNGKYVYEVQENQGQGARSTSIDITTGVDGYSETVTVTQKGLFDIKILWTRTYASYSKTLSSPILRLAEAGDYLLVSTGSSVFAVNRLSGEYVTDIPAPEGLTIHSLTNDDAGNIVFAANASYGGTFDVYSMTDLSDTPKLVLSYPHTDIYSSSMGNLRVKGNVKGNAAVTASVDVSQYWVAWQIENGTASSATFGAAPAGSSQIWNPQSLCTAPVSDNLSDGLLYIGYTGDYNLEYCADYVQNSWTPIFMTGSAGNENYNCLSTAEFNGRKYVAYEAGSHWNWGNCPEVHLIDITDISNASETMMVSSSDITGGASYTGAGASSDVLLTVSDDGGTMYIYVTDGNYDCISCISVTAQ